MFLMVCNFSEISLLSYLPIEVNICLFSIFLNVKSKKIGCFLCNLTYIQTNTTEKFVLDLYFILYITV